MAYAKPTTLNGYDLFECASALQKAIRRNIEEVAMHFAVELHISGYGEYLWKRLKIISSEDIGLANPNIPANIQSLYAMYADQLKKSDGKKAPERLYITHAVLMLCRSEKSRLVDWGVVRYWNNPNQGKMEVPDYAFDNHTLKGKRMGRTIDYFYTESCLLSPHTMLDKEEEYKEIAYTNHKYKFEVEAKMKEDGIEVTQDNIYKYRAGKLTQGKLF